MTVFSIEQCLKEENNRFRLVLAAAKRARQLEEGHHSSSGELDKNKSTVIALREIAEGKISIQDMVRSGD